MANTFWELIFHLLFISTLGISTMRESLRKQRLINCPPSMDGKWKNQDPNPSLSGSWAELDICAILRRTPATNSLHLLIPDFGVSKSVDRELEKQRRPQVSKVSAKQEDVGCWGSVWNSASSSVRQLSTPGSKESQVRHFCFLLSWVAKKSFKVLACYLEDEGVCL